MKISATKFKGRNSWTIENDLITLTMLQGGGHLASLTLKDNPKVNPFWIPVWKTMEPWQYNEKRHETNYQSKLLASISGHNICLGWFGDASKAEEKQGLGCHGEAPIVRWEKIKTLKSAKTITLITGCDMPITGMQLKRTIRLREGSYVIKVQDEVSNTTRRDLPFTMCQHVTLGPPFLEKGITVFDTPATKCHTFPGHFEDSPRLQTDKSFSWPKAPGVKGEKVDMRMVDKKYRVSSDFSTQLMDPAKEIAWFSAVNANLGMMIAYIWKRQDYPWLGNWEENYGRKDKPWAGKSLTRGMEFANTPFPTGLQAAIKLGTFQGQPTFAWLPAKGKQVFEYDILASPVLPETTGVADIKPQGTGYSVEMITR